MGKDAHVLIDAGQIFAQDVAKRGASGCRPWKSAGVLVASKSRSCPTLWQPTARSRQAAAAKVQMAGGEGCHSSPMAFNLIDFGKVGFIQIDTGRIGGIGPAKEVADYAVAKGVTFVNHTFTSHLAALSASLQPHAGSSPITSIAGISPSRRASSPSTSPAITSCRTKTD